MNRMTSITACIFALAAILTGCGKNLDDNNKSGKDNEVKLEPPVDIQLTKSEVEMASDVNQFGFRLFSDIQSQSLDKDMMMSPLSISLALSMAATGSDGATSEEMTQVLGFEGRSVEEMDQFYFKMLEGLAKADKSVTFEVANSIWTARGLKVLDSFISDCGKWFSSEIYPDIDFGASSTPGRINKWCSDKTHGKIDKVVDSPDPNVMMMLINALYFNGKWGITFPDVAKRTFHGAKGDVKMDFMQGKASLPYCKDSKTFEAVSLPYGNGAFRMAVIKPLNGCTVGEALNGLASDWTSYSRSLKFGSGDVQFRMPEFKVEYFKDITGDLQNMGMVDAFSDCADFSRMTGPDQSLKISRVSHKTFIDVNHLGTEAAAVTVVEMKFTTAMPQVNPIREFYVDDPFAYVIYEQSTGAVLFIGTKN